MKKKWTPFILSGVFVIIAFLVVCLPISDLNNKIDEQNTELAKLQNELTMAQSLNKSSHDKIVVKSTGLDANRTMNDNKIAIEFIKKCLTWSSYEEYNEIRNSLITDYKLDTSSNFLTVFMPEVVNATSPDGTNYNRIDIFGYNLSYEKMDSYVTDISNDGKYSYFSFVTVSSRDKNGKEGTTMAAFIYTIDVDGNITNIDASAVS